MREKWNMGLPILMMVVFAMTRWPGLMPPNFSAAYALVFCAGVYFPGKMAWWLPLATLFASDVLLNIHYSQTYGIDSFQPYQLINYAVYAVIIWFGRRFSPKSSWFTLVGGGLMSAVLFYLLTNTAAWLLNPFNNPEYTKTISGWLIALTKGTAGWPETWTLFRNTLLGGGLFTGLFAGAMKLTEATEPETEEAEAEAEENAPEEAQAKA